MLEIRSQKCDTFRAHWHGPETDMEIIAAKVCVAASEER